MENVKIFKEFVDSKDCEIMIERLEHLCNNDKALKTDNGKIGLVNSEDAVFQEFIDKYYDKTIKAVNDQFTKYNGYTIKKYLEGVGMNTHLDSEEGKEFGALMYLNDNYEGGELTYTAPDGVEHAIKPKKGDMIYFPSWYPHGVNIVTKGQRYFFTISLLKQ